MRLCCPLLAGLPLAGLLLIGLATSPVRAQTPADSSEAVRDSIVVETIVRQPDRGIVRTRIRVDSVVSRREGPARRARLAFPTEGGVFYYRAGAGSAIRRAPAARPEASSPETIAQPPARADGRGVPRAGDRAARPASGVTPADLDRLERRLMDRLDRRMDRESQRRQPVPVVIPPARTDRAPERPGVTGVPVAPADSLRGVPRADLAEPPDVREEPDVTPEIVERAILDTGLFRTSRVFFAFGEADLLPLSRRVLDTIADVLLRYPELRIEVGGHTDAISSDAFNLELSQRRAGSVVTYLIARGIDARQLEAVGYGEARPVATNETETGRALNRRVEFVVLRP